MVAGYFNFTVKPRGQRIDELQWDRGQDGLGRRYSSYVHDSDAPENTMVTVLTIQEPSLNRRGPSNYYIVFCDVETVEGGKCRRVNAYSADVMGAELGGLHELPVLKDDPSCFGPLTKDQAQILHDMAAMLAAKRTVQHWMDMSRFELSQSVSTPAPSAGQAPPRP